jgi:hypothetical protein
MYCRYRAADQEIERYIEKITVPEDKYELYLEIKAYSKAVDIAVKLRDPYRLQEVKLLVKHFSFFYLNKIVNRWEEFVKIKSWKDTFKINYQRCNKEVLIVLVFVESLSFFICSFIMCTLINTLFPRKLHTR